MDVETSGLYPDSHRVLSVVAIALDERGRPEHRVASLIDAGCDPGPTHIHGITRKMLAGSPSFQQVLPKLAPLLDGRVMVAHNASFDFGFLAAEAGRINHSLPTQQRLCTLALSRRLGLDVANHQLATLASYWGVTQRRAHDAEDDARVLAEVFVHSAAFAERLDMPLPLMRCDTLRGRAAAATRVIKQPCLWRNPGPLRTGQPLVQGMKIAITGDTATPREVLVKQLAAAGLDPVTSVSRLTSALVCNSPYSDSGKSRRACAEGIAVIDERTLIQLLGAVQPGTPKPAPAAALPVPIPAAPTKPTVPAARKRVTILGPMSRRRVLVLGGPHETAAQIRAHVIAQGGAAAVNLSANVTNLVVLAGAENDQRITRAVGAGVAVHHGTADFNLGPAIAESPPSQVALTRPVPVLARGSVTDLPTAGGVWTANVAWQAAALPDGVDLDVVAFMVDAEGNVAGDDDFVFYNAPISPDGAVALSIDGDSEQSVRIDLDQLPEHCTRVVVAAALDGPCSFGEIGAVTVSIDGSEATAATATLDAATTERSLLLAEIYNRSGTWRVRAVGQGYDYDLAALAKRHGVVVED